MQTQEIPSEQWGPFFDGFTRLHEGEAVSIEIQSPDIGVQPQAQGVRLVSVTFDPKDSTGEEIDVVVSNAADAELMHAITHPKRVRIARTDDGFDSALQVESQEGQATLVRFEEPRPPEDLDDDGGDLG